MGTQTAVTASYQAFLDVPHPTPSSSEEAVRIETTTLLPGGGLVVVTVRTGVDGFIVNDDGAGRMAMLALGIQDLTRGDVRRGNDIAEAQGLSFDGQGFSLSEVSADQIPAAIAYVADACRTWSAAALEARSRRLERDLAEQTVERLRAAIPGAQIEKDREVLGASTKRHTFDVVVTLPNERLALFEVLTPAPASMAAVHLKFYDLLQAHEDWPREAVVEDLSVWPSQDIAVMQQVASHVRGLRNAWADIEQLVA